MKKIEIIIKNLLRFVFASTLIIFFINLYLPEEYTKKIVWEFIAYNFPSQLIFKIWWVVFGITIFLALFSKQEKKQEKKWLVLTVFILGLLGIFYYLFIYDFIHIEKIKKRKLLIIILFALFSTLFSLSIILTIIHKRSNFLFVLFSFLYFALIGFFINDLKVRKAKNFFF